MAVDGLHAGRRPRGLWVVRDVRSGEIVLAKSLLSARQTELGELLRRVVAGLATRTRDVTVSDPAGADRVAWVQLRAELEHRRERRVERRRFRRDPHGYLMGLEDELNQLRLPGEKNFRAARTPRIGAALKPARAAPGEVPDAS